VIRHGIDERERGAHRLLGIVLQRARIADVGEHAVAHVAGDHSVVAADHLAHPGAVGCGYALHVLRLQPCHETTRADEIAEHHRQLPSLGLVARSRLCRRRGRRERGRVERRDGAPHLAAMLRQDAELREVAVSQIADGRELDGALGEAFPVLPQADRRQPFGDSSHGSAPLRHLDRSGPGLPVTTRLPVGDANQRGHASGLAHRMAAANEG
jgi:hypothetical protein